MAAKTTNTRKAPPIPFEVCILAGGLSARMGRDKSRLQLNGRTLLAHIRAAVKPLHVSVRVIRRDIVPRCGPIGGIYTALQSSHAPTLLFLSCDMPFLTPELLKLLVASLRTKDNAAFTRHGTLAGFPYLLRREIAQPIVKRQITGSQFSLQSLAKALRARLLRPPHGWLNQLANLNTLGDLQAARLQLKGAPLRARVETHKSLKHGLSKRRYPSKL